MKLIDTHAHLYVSAFDRDRESVIHRAAEVVEAVCLPNIDINSIGPMHGLVDRAPDLFFPMIGLHPSHVKADFEEVLEQIEKQLYESPYTYIGIGETGIDLYWDKTTLDIQIQSLEKHIKWAKKERLPIILHAREAIDEVIAVIEKHHDSDLRGIVHCFDGTIEQARRIADLETFYIGMGGIVTYRKDVQQMLKEAELSWIVLETDSPYLPPIPHRKDKPRRNESSYIQYVGKKMAEIKGVSYEEIAERTNKNAASLFAFPEALQTQLLKRNNF